MQDDGGNYTIIRLEDDYSMALVGNPDRKSIWLLARDKDAFSSTLAGEYVETAREQVFEVDKLLVADWDNRVMLEEARDND